MTLWVDNDTVWRALQARDASLLERSGAKFCVSNDYATCVVLRHHDAWLIDGEGWRDANEPPSTPSAGRQMLNFYCASPDDPNGIIQRWFKAFVPLRVQVGELRAAGACFSLAIDGRICECRFDVLPRLMWDVMTGHAQPEAKIEATFDLIWR